MTIPKKEKGDGPTSSLTRNLTQREQEVLRLLSEGMSAGDIARTLRVSERTVTTHRTMIYRKLAVNNRFQAALLFLRGGVVAKGA